MCCLLTLTIQACSGGSASKANTPAPKDLSADELRAMIKESDKPYTLINFFATWCKPCIQELPDLVALHNDPQSKIQVVLISIDAPDVAASKLHDFVADKGIDFQTYVVTKETGAFISQFYTIWNERIPLSLLYSKAGRMVEALEGITDRAEIELIVNMHEKLGS